MEPQPKKTRKADPGKPTQGKKLASGLGFPGDALGGDACPSDAQTARACASEVSEEDDGLPLPISLPLKTNTVSAPFTCVDYPWSRLLLQNIKQYEIRAYGLPATVVENGGNVWLLEMPGEITAEDIRLVPMLREMPQKVDDYAIIGMLRFGHSTRYASWAEFDADLFQHCLHPAAQGYFSPAFRRYGIMPYKWQVLASRELNGYLRQPGLGYLKETTILTHTADFMYPNTRVCYSDLQEHWLTYFMDID